MSGSRRVETAN